MFKNLVDVDINGKKVLIRGDLNVPFMNGKVTDTTRIDSLKKTVEYIVDNGGYAFICSHFGRPKGQKNEEFSLSQIVPEMVNVFKKDIVFIDDCIDRNIEDAMKQHDDVKIFCFENLRFYKEEELNDSDFATKLGQGFDLYVNDAFSVSHRAHASTVAIADVLPAFCGVNMLCELDNLNSSLNDPKKPVTAIVGGAKISTKIDVLKNLSSKVDNIIIGGGMANTFLFANGNNIGKSLCEADMVDTVKEIIANAKKNNCKIVLPVDVVVSNDINNGVDAKEISLDEINDDDAIFDVGTKSIDLIKSVIKDSKTLIWNGPLGAFEFKPFGNATFAIVEEVVSLTTSGELVSVCGGGDTVSALENCNAKSKMTFVSTAGGAFLEWMEGKKLPGVDVLS